MNVDNLRRAVVVISIIVLIGAGVIGFLFALDNIVNEKQDSVIDLNPTDEKYDPSNSHQEGGSKTEKSDVSTTLFIMTDSTGKNAELAFTATVDYANYNINLIFYPVDVSVSSKIGDQGWELATIAEFYSKYGIEKTGSVVSGILSIPVSGAVSFTSDAAADLIDSFTKGAGVSYFPPCKINAKTPDGTSVSISKSKASFNGTNAVKLVTFYRTDDNIYDADMVKFYDGTRVPQNKIAATFIDAFVTQRLIGEIDSYYKDSYVQFFKTFLSKCKGSPGSSFPEKLAASEKNFDLTSVNAYVVKSVLDPTATMYVFGGSDGGLIKVDAESGSINESFMSNKVDAYKKLLASFY